MKEKNKDIEKMKPDDYMNYDSYAIEKLTKESIQYRLILTSIYNTYKEKYNNYFQILHIISEELIKNNITDEMMISTIISKMIWSGLLSKNDNFKFYIDYKNAISLTAFPVIEGEACCRNIALLLNDVLKMMNISSYRIGCNEYKTTMIPTELDIVRKNIEDEELNHNYFSIYEQSNNKYQINHMANIFDYYGKKVLFDPTNIAIYEMKSYVGDIIGGQGKVLVQPYTLMRYEGISYDDMIDYFNEIKNNKQRIDKKNVLFNFNEGLKFEYDREKIKKKINCYIKKIND